MKILILGHARHGKDTVANLLAKYNKGIKYVPTSTIIADYVRSKIYPEIQYDSIDECYEDRVNHRVLWFELVKLYNHSDNSALAKKILSWCDIYCGMRSIEELRDSCFLFDRVIWVFNERLALESGSFNITVNDMIGLFSDKQRIVIENNSTLESLEQTISELHL